MDFNSFSTKLDRVCNHSAYEIVNALIQNLEWNGPWYGNMSIGFIVELTLDLFQWRILYF